MLIWLPMLSLIGEYHHFNNYFEHPIKKDMAAASSHFPQQLICVLRLFFSHFEFLTLNSFLLGQLTVVPMFTLTGSSLWLLAAFVMV